ncbi:sugar phosphate isomerase/epimerase [Candidatus Woesearchaeota archaeon]|nr:sugar phosphate isomerase/epimerase [Candidatus Woesearchaeota archaeon]MBT6519847.1 sugar phosphate isomerase/epimerase [Candidatus Woesearchaeota archaeon]MBT7367139.1 sugar phosphate isomerase/epimerase [Candidatus Woesearchaeota archaeon]
MITTYSCFLEAKDVLNPEFNLDQYIGCSVQLNFYHGFFDLEHSDIRRTLRRNSIFVSSIHAPDIKISDPKFMDLAKIVAKEYNKKYITIHPCKSDDPKQLRKEELSALEAHADELARLKLNICFENFPTPAPEKQERWVYDPADLRLLTERFPFVGITYDLSHTEPGTDILEEFNKIVDGVRIIHLSNRRIDEKDKWHVHLPFYEGDLPVKELLASLDQSDFIGDVVLEYRVEDHPKMVRDYWKLFDGEFVF